MELEVEDELLEEGEEEQDGLASVSYFPLRLPVSVTDNYGNKYSLRSRIPLWRTKYTRPSTGEAYFYQQIVLNHLPRDFEAEKVLAGGSWRGTLENTDNVLEDEVDVEQTAFDSVQVQAELNRLYASASETQKSLARTVVANSAFGLHVVCGAAGVGKSYLLNILYLKYKLLGYNVVKLAPTGVAAYNIQGQTIHRFFGMSNRPNVFNAVRLDEYFKTHQKTVLLIDECSMISKTLASVMNEALVTTLTRNALLGGVETVFFGDFAQLTPVNEDEGRFFESPVFQQATKLVVTESQRQSDQAFISILHKVRIFDIDVDVRDFIYDRLVLDYQIPSNAVKLYTTNKKVNSGNARSLAALQEEEHTLPSQDYFSGNRAAARSALRETRFLHTLVFKIGVPLMLIHNVDVENGWTNGSICKLISVTEAGLLVKHSITNTFKILKRVRRTVPGTGYSRFQYPVTVAFACTIHKVQSMTLPAVAIHLQSMQSHGQLYVAMSRVKSANDVCYFGFIKGTTRHLNLIADPASILLVDPT